jgi:serine/threonine protein phosphatase PrpC
MTTFFTSHPFSVPVNSGPVRPTPAKSTIWQSLPGKDKASIIGVTLLCSIVATPLGGALAFFGSSFYFRQKRVGQISQEHFIEQEKVRKREKEEQIEYQHSPEKNLQRAFRHHGLKLGFDEAKNLAATPEKAKTLKIDYAASASEGKGCRMQDVHSCKSAKKDGFFTFLFDGHGPRGKELAHKANRFISNHLAEESHALSEASSFTAIRSIFQTALNKFQSILNREPLGMDSGASCALTHINTRNNRLSVATLGDVKVKIVRGDQILPLSPVIDWRSGQEIERVKDGEGDFTYGDQTFEKEQLLAKSPNERGSMSNRLFFNTKGQPLNLSRSLGDQAAPSISQQAEVTTIRLEPGDKIVAASKGFWNYIHIVDDKKMQKVLEKPVQKNENIARKLVKAALKNHSELMSDNITVSVTAVSEKK